MMESPEGVVEQIGGPYPKNLLLRGFWVGMCFAKQLPGTAHAVDPDPTLQTMHRECTWNVNALTALA